MALTTGRAAKGRSSLGLAIATALCVTAVLACGGQKQDGIAGPKFNPISPADGGAGGQEESWGGEAGAAGATDPGASDPGAGSGGADPGSPDPAPDPAPSGPVNAPGCGANGNACCVDGAACADNQAQCCTQCSGAPDYTCHCNTAYQAGGNCRVCCVVCNNGKTKGSPLYVSGSSCQDAAQAWCKSHFGVGADGKSGWRAQCG